MIRTSDDFDLFTNFIKHVQMLLMHLYLDEACPVGESMILIDEWA